MEFNIDKALEILEQTPDTLISLLGNLSDEWIQNNEGANSWSPFDIVGHFIHGEKTDWIPRLHSILNEDDKRFKPFDRFAQFEISKGKNVDKLLAEFKTLRAQNIVHLTALKLTKEQLELTGIHPEFGQVSAKELLATWVAHDLGHIAQIARVLAKQYKNEVGPWEAYIPVLKK